MKRDNRGSSFVFAVAMTAVVVVGVLAAVPVLAQAEDLAQEAVTDTATAVAYERVGVESS